MVNARSKICQTAESIWTTLNYNNDATKKDKNNLVLFYSVDQQLKILCMVRLLSQL